MTERTFPALDPVAISATRDALHAWSRVLGGWLKSARARRKHWWHASLRPTVRGLGTGVVHAGADFDIELDCVNSELRVRTARGEAVEALTGQPSAGLATWLDGELAGAGVDAALAPGGDVRGREAFAGYEPRRARQLQRALASVATALEDFRAGIREETSPIQVWPHHFDLSMIWLPGSKVPGQDPADEEHADKQMNFGFVFGDESITEPYLYVTAYPLPDALAETDLPAGSNWRSDGFSGAVLLYRDLAAVDDPSAYLQDLWSRMLAAGQAHLAHDR